MGDRSSGKVSAVKAKIMLEPVRAQQGQYDQQTKGSERIKVNANTNSKVSYRALHQLVLVDK